VIKLQYDVYRKIVQKDCIVLKTNTILVNKAEGKKRGSTRVEAVRLKVISVSQVEL
jgi:hypothetical protein